MYMYIDTLCICTCVICVCEVHVCTCTLNVQCSILCGGSLEEVRWEGNNNYVCLYTLFCTLIVVYIVMYIITSTLQVPLHV